MRKIILKAAMRMQWYSFDTRVTDTSRRSGWERDRSGAISPIVASRYSVQDKATQYSSWETRRPRIVEERIPMDSKLMIEIIKKGQDAFGEIPIVIRTQNAFKNVGKISVLEVKELGTSIVICTDDLSDEIFPNAKQIRDGDDEYLKEH